MNTNDSDTSDSSEETLVLSQEKQITRVSFEDKQIMRKRDHKLNEKSFREPDQSDLESSGSRSTLQSYEAFTGDFYAEKLQIVPKTEKNSSKNSSDGDSTADDVSTICEDEVQVEDLVDQSENSAMPNRVKSRFEDRFSADDRELGLWVTNYEKVTRRPQTAGEITQPYEQSKALFKSKSRCFSGDEDETVERGHYSGMRRYSSTGDLRQNVRTNTKKVRRQLPDVSNFKSVRDTRSASEDDKVQVPFTPGDRETLEAQYKLLYRENVNLDKAYGELQEKVRCESPQILSNKFLSPRETEWQSERKQLKREIEHLHEQVSHLQQALNSIKSSEIFPVSGSLSPTSEKTERYFKEKLQNLQKVKDDEIARLSEQVSYWLKQAETQNKNKKVLETQRIAELEQSEAFLQCQLVNLEDQLLSSKNELRKVKTENTDLGEHCTKLENCLAVIDAEKSLLDELKQQNGELRNNLSAAEREEKILIEKLTRLAEENADLEEKASKITSKQGDEVLNKKIENLTEEIQQLQNERTSYKDRCTGLEDVRECLVQQITTMEEEFNSESNALSQQINKLNENIKITKEDRDKIKESNEQLELDQELSLNMTETLNKRISDLQNHIETLKCQLDGQKRKITSFNEVQEQLAAVVSEKCDLAVLVDKYKNDIEILRTRLTEQQEHLTESFERANKQLVEETCEMETSQRHLAVENELLRMRSCSRAFDAAVGRKLREDIVDILSACENALSEVLSKEQDENIFRIFSGMNQGDILFDEEMTESEAADILNHYGEELIGATVKELQEMQKQSPRLGDVLSFSQLIADVKENYKFVKMFEAIKLTIENIPTLLKTYEAKFATLSEENDSLRMSLDSSANQKTQKETDVDSNETSALYTLSRELHEMKIELGQVVSNEESLTEKLKSSQRVCEELSARIQTLQEEKFQLIQNSAESLQNVEVNDVLKKSKAQVLSVQEQNQSLCDELKMKEKKFSSTKQKMTERIDDLKDELAKSKASQDSLRKNLDDTQNAGEALLQRFETTKNEQIKTIEKLKSEIKYFSSKNEIKNEHLIETEEKLQNTLENQQSMEKNILNLTGQIADLENQLKSQTASLVEAEEASAQRERENVELKIKLDNLEREKQEEEDGDSDVRKEEIKQLRDELFRKSDIVDNQKEIIEELNRKLDQLNKAIAGGTSLHDDNIQLTEQIKNLKKENLDLIQKIDELRLFKTENMKTDFSLHSAKNQVSSDRIRCLEQEISDLKSLNRDIKRQSDDALNEKISMIEQIREECQQLQLALSVEVQKREAKSQVKHEKSLNKECYSDNSSQHVNHDLVTSLQNDLVRKSKQLEKMNKEKKEAGKQLISLSEAMENLVEKNVILSNELSEYKETVISLKKQASTSLAIEEQSENREQQALNVLQTESIGETATKKCCSSVCQKDKDTMLSELECLRAKCLSIEQKLNGKAKTRSIKGFARKAKLRKMSADDKGCGNAEQEFSNTTKSAHAEVEEMYSLKKDKFCAEISQSISSDHSDSDEARSTSHSSVSNSSSSDWSENEKSSNLKMRSKGLLEENKKLQFKINELQQVLNNQKKSADAFQANSWLQMENDRLLTLLEQAEQEACSSQAEKEKLQEVIARLQATGTLSDAEGNNQQSGTESEPEAVYQERKRRRENEYQKEIDNLKLHLQETECLVVAHKNNLHHVESLNEDLRLSNAKLHDQIEQLEKDARLPNHPVIQSVCAEMRESALYQAAATEEYKTPAGTWTERETFPLDRVVEVLCEKVLETEQAIANKKLQSEELSSTLDELREQLWSLQQKNTCLEQEALGASKRVEKSEKELDDSSNKVKALESLLSMNEANSKESLRSKEEDAEKLQAQLLSLSLDLEARREEIANVERARMLETDQYEKQLGDMQRHFSDISKKLDDKLHESEDLLNKTQLFESRCNETAEELNKKSEEVTDLQLKVDDLRRENKEKAKLAEQSMIENQKLSKDLNSTVQIQFDTIDHLKNQISSLEENTNHLRETMASRDQNIVSLSGELSEKEEQIEVLSARVEELVQTEEALKTTMDTADDIIAEREKQHIDEVEKLKDGLNQTLSKARCAEMTSEELHNEIADLDDVIKTLRSEIEGLRKDENDVAFQIEKMEMERALMDTSLDNAREETSELVETNQALMQENAELNETIEEMQLAMAKLNTQLSKYREQSDKYAQEITERETEIESVKDENLRIRKQLDQQMPTDQFSQSPKRSGNTDGAIDLESELEDAKSQLSHVHGLLEKFRIDKIHLENEIRRMQEDYHGHYHMALFSPKEPAIQEEGELSSSAREYGSELYSQRTLSEGHLPELSAEQLSAHLQEESLSLRSENEVLRSKIASLEGSITEMTERLVPKLELGSIADESDAKHKASHGNDDDTGRYVEDIDTTRASGTATVQKLEEKLHMSEEAGAKLLMQVQEMEEEANVLRSNLQDLSDQNNTLQKQFFGTISENFQTQVDELSLANASLKEVLQKKDENLDEVKEELSQISAAESQLRHRYKEVQGVAEELRQQLQQAETDNHDLQQRLLDLDDEYRNMMQHDEGQEKNPGYDDMKQMTSDVSAQTLSIGELLQEIREGRQGKKIGNVVENGNADTEDDVSDLESSSSSSSKTSNDDAILNPVKTSIPNLADDELLQETILKVFPQSQKGNFNIEDIPEPVTNSLAEDSQATEQPSVSNTTLKSLQNELVGYQLLVEKLKRRNQDLLEGSGAAMTQDDKESLEREVSALRGQVALLERNNRIFSDRERTDLKQDLDLANKRCSSFQSQLQAIKASLDYEEVMKVKKQLSDVSKKADEFEAKLQEYEKEETSDSDDSHSSDDSNKPTKYARLLELEEEAEELKNKIEERDEDMKDRDVMIEELQHQLKHIKQQYTDEVEQLEKQNHDKEKELQEEIKELEREVSDKKEMLKLKQANLKNKSNELDDRDDDIEKLQKDIQKKNKEIEQLRWEVESLQRENLSLLKRIDQLKQALSSSNDPALFEAALSPVATFRSPSTGSISTRVRSRSSTPKSSFQDSPDAKRSNRSHDSIGSNYITAFDDHLEPVRSRRAFSFDVDHETPTSALREGIHEAKETVHQMGDVLDTPRMSPSRRMSPVPGSKFASGMSAEYSSPLSSAAHVGGITGIKSKSAPFNNEDKTYQENVKSSKKPKNKEKNKRFKGHSSSSSSSSQEETCDSESDSKSDIVTKKNRGASAASLNPDLSILTIPSKNSTKANEETLVFDSVYPLEVEDGPTRSLASPKARRVKRYTHPQKLKHDKDISDSSTSSSDDSTVSAETTSKSQREDAATFNPSHALNKDLNKTAMHQQKTVSGDLTSSEATTDQRNQSSEAETPVTSDVDTNLKAPFSQGDEPPINTKINDPLSIMFTSNERESTSSLKEAMQPRDSASTMPGSFISDERSALIQEVAKAREEANKWFAEVTEADREKRKLGRRLEALENELVRLKDVENNFDLMKKHQDDVKQVSRDLAAVRTQAEIANRKAEEAREKNALLKAHLLDREEVQNENKELKRSIEKMKRKTEDPNASNSALPLSELQQTVLSPQTGKPSSENTSPPKMVTSPTDKQLNEIKESFEYIASNFADLVLRKHDAELQLAPQQAKVSQLKRKCLERDQLLAKFVLNLRKKKSDTTADDTSDSCSESVASSPSLAAILAQADRVIRADALDGDTSEADSAVVKLNRSNSDIIGTTARTKDFLSPPRPPSALMRTLSAKSSNSSRSSPTHRIYIAKHDYAPSSRIPSSNNENHLPVTHSLLPDLSLLSGDTVVAIGNPDQREDGKLYQMAEVRGKIGFVPLGHLVAAEQVEGMQAFVQGRGKTDRKRSATSSPEKIVNLYKKLEQAHLMVADKIEKNSKVKPFSPPKQNNGKPKTKKSSFSTPDHDSTTEYASSEASHKPFLQQGRDKKSSRRKREDKPPKYKSTNDPDHLPPSHDASLYNDHLPKRSESNPLTSKMSDNNSDLFGDNKHADSDSSFVPIYGVNNRDDRIRSSTPVQPPSHHRRSSSVPLRRNSSSRSSRSEFSTPGKFMSPSRSTESSPRKERSRSSSRNKDKNRHSNSSFRNTSSSHGPSHIASPHPPTFLVVEKTMGLKSMIIRWTPPLLDMISRSNNLPVIGYEISVDKQRKVQISGAYTNKAILGDLNLTATLTIEVRTVTSVGTLSTPCEVIFTPNLSSSANTTSHSPRPVSQASRSPPSKKSNNRSRDSVIQQKATALYDYDPIVDSPYKTQHDEVALRQGEEVTIVGSPRPDGFCDVQVGSRRGFAPISFLISDCDDSVSSYKPPLQGNDTKKLRHKRRTKGKDRTHRYSSSGSSFRN